MTLGGVCSSKRNPSIIATNYSISLVTVLRGLAFGNQKLLPGKCPSPYTLLHMIAHIENSIKEPLNSNGFFENHEQLGSERAEQLQGSVDDHDQTPDA